MKVTKTTISESELSSTLDLFEGRKLSAETKQKIREEVGTYLVEQSLIQISNSKSPVEGETIAPLKKGPYREKKLKELGTSRADLQFSGEYLDSYDFQPAPEGIRLGVFGERAGAADGHNNFSGKSALPKRRTLPDEGQQFKPAIQREVDRIIADAVLDETAFTKKDFRDVLTRTDLYDVLRKKLGDLSRSELSLAVFRNEDLVDLLNEMDLLRLLT